MKITRTLVAAAVAVLALSAGCSAADEGSSSGGISGSNGNGGSAPGNCTPPSCQGCAACYASCLCQTGQAQQCTAACGTGAGGTGTFGTGGVGGGTFGTGGGAGTYGTGGTGTGGFGTGGTGTGGFGTGGTGTGGFGTGGTAGGLGTGGESGTGTGGIGTGGGVGTGGAGAGGAGGIGGGGTIPTIPPTPANCPTLATGNITVMGKQVQLWVGPAGRAGPIVFYWHGTGSNSGEAGLLGPAVNEIQSGGGVIASFTTTTATGTNTGNNVWYTGDFAMADEILACGVAQGVVDPRMIYTAGCSAGGLQASAMVYGRSSYLAAAMPNSGGTVFGYQLQDPGHVPATITTHGGSSDVVGINFGQTTARFNQDIAAKGGFVVNCNHGGGHCASTAAVKAAQWEFAKAHPFGVTPEPYQGGLPGSFPSVCQIIP